MCVRAVASRGSPAPGSQCLHRPPPELVPPPRLAAPPLVKPNPLALGQKSTSKQKKKKKKDKKTPLMHRERGALDSAAFKISPYKLGGRPLQGLRPGVMAPPAPPSVRHCVRVYTTLCTLFTSGVSFALSFIVSVLSVLAAPKSFLINCVFDDTCVRYVLLFISLLFSLFCFFVFLSFLPSLWCLSLAFTRKLVLFSFISNGFVPPLSHCVESVDR